jgi:membrane protease YdiL (CAAX protease family)
MRTGEASGLQIAFLSFALLLLAVPLSDYMSRALGSTPDEAAITNRFLHFALAAIILLGFPKLRAFALTELSRPIPRGRRAEVAAVAFTKILVLIGFVGAFALWAWANGGNDTVAYALKSDPVDVALAKAYSTYGLLESFLLGAIVAPLIEEVVFRGLLYRAWEKRWGGFAAAVLSSALFASYHPHFFAAFTSAIIFVCLVRRTGTLWSSIAVHSFSNLVLWYPIVGPFMFPGADQPSGELSAWTLHLACLAFTVIAVPLYVWLAVRKPHAVST